MHLYVQKASKQGFTVIDVTKPVTPSLVNFTAPSPATLLPVNWKSWVPTWASPKSRTRTPRESSEIPIAPQKPVRIPRPKRPGASQK